MQAHPVLSSDHNEFFGSLQGGLTVSKKYVIDNLPKQGPARATGSESPFAPVNLKPFASSPRMMVSITERLLLRVRERKLGNQP